VGVHQFYDLKAVGVVAFGMVWILACFASCLVVWSSAKRRPSHSEAAAIEAVDARHGARHVGARHVGTELGGTGFGGTGLGGSRFGGQPAPRRVASIGDVREDA
jgi:hypothetical protein